MSVNYTLATDKKYMFFTSKNNSKEEAYSGFFTIEVKKDDIVFIDIVNQFKNDLWEFNIYMPNGDIHNNVYGIPHVTGDLIIKHITDEDLLDGRFNYRK